jgi:hypothetical protein
MFLVAQLVPQRLVYQSLECLAGRKEFDDHDMLAMALRERIKQIGADEKSDLAAPASLSLVKSHSHRESLIPPAVDVWQLQKQQYA